MIRTSHLAQAVAFATLDNGTLVGATKGPTFFCYKAEPGEHTLRIEADEPTTVKLQAVGGRSYYLHEKVPFGFMLRCDAECVSEPKARELVERLDLRGDHRAPRRASTRRTRSRSPKPLPARCA